MLIFTHTVATMCTSKQEGVRVMLEVTDRIPVCILKLNVPQSLLALRWLCNWSTLFPSTPNLSAENADQQA